MICQQYQLPAEDCNDLVRSSLFRLGDLPRSRDAKARAYN